MRLLPPYARQRFSTWFEKRPKISLTQRQGKVTVFPTCLVEYQEPAIGHDLVKVYRLAVDPTCQVTGMPITAENSHVHHAPPMFDTIADSFAEHVGGYDLLAGRLKTGDNVYGSYMVEDDCRSWLTWHGQRAVLLLVHRSANAHIEAARRNIKKDG